MGLFTKSRQARLMVGAAACALALGANAAWAQAKPITIPPQTLASALHDFGAQTGRQIMFTPESAASKMSRGVEGATDEGVALAQLLQGTGLTWRRSGDTYLVVSATDPQSAGAVGDGAETNVVQELVVTAQKKSENIQVVPIAISAFTQQDLTTRQVAGGPDLMTQVPNMTFTKTNFSSYSIQIRGIGTQAISATTDAAVAVAFNNTPFIRNRFFEQEFYDLERVEVLRGPQGTLYGRNATAGVVNILSAKPVFDYEERLSADIANYGSKRLEGMVNMPLVDDKVALRVAGAWTKRDGYDTNSITGSKIDGRDLWSTRLSLRIEPTDTIRANFIWEHFQEDDDRLRSGKQLCHTDEVTSVGGFPVTHLQTLPEAGQSILLSGVEATFSQGCAPASLYSPDSFETPNGLSLPYYLPLQQIGLPATLDDPYLSRTQSRDLRTIESTVDPQYRAKTDLAELQFGVDLSNNLTLTSETGYLSDTLFSEEDYDRFNTAPGAFNPRPGLVDEKGFFCDPQIGCANRLVAVDLSTAKSRQFSQEFRLSSAFTGPFNFSLGANFLRYDTEDKYYVFINTLTATAVSGGVFNNVQYIPGVSDNHECLTQGLTPPDPNTIYNAGSCVYVDPNPIGSLNDLGHNYFLSKNPYKLISYAVFGEVYYNITDTLKLTAGLRWTVDKKEAPRIPSWVLAGGQPGSAPSGAGYTVAEIVRQEWREPTGRLALDWRPALALTDQTLVYASYAHGYKAGGANPPTYGQSIYCLACGGSIGVANGLLDNNAAHPKTFDPEFVNAFEIGTKNTLLEGRLTLNADVFYYEYTGYQISQIIDRSASNLNFDTKVWGAELEADWRPLKNLRLGFKGGYENTRVADGMKAVDIMDRTAGHKDWVVVSPFPTFPSNCILPLSLFIGGGDGHGGPGSYLVNLGGPGGGNPGACEIAYALGLDPVTDLPYKANPTEGGYLSTLRMHPDYAGFDPRTAPNGGAGFFKDLSGHELPNAPHFTATLTADYTVPLPREWLATLHADLYGQSEAWTRIFNTPGYDRLKSYTNVNLAAIFSNEPAGLKVMAYVKNVFDHDSITGAFLNSDDTGLTTNVFLTEPRLYGVRVTKEWNGGTWWTGANPNHKAGEPYPLTVEIGGQVERHDAGYGLIKPGAFDAFEEAVDPSTAENQDLDLGDGREVRLSYRPEGSRWTVSAGYRFGKANGSSRAHKERIAGEKACVFPKSSLFGKLRCDPTFAYAGYPAGYFYLASASLTPVHWSDIAVSRGEERQMLDFAVGRDVGLGLPGEGGSTLALELRILDLKSTTYAVMSGIPDWQIPDGWFYATQTKHRYDATINATRRFQGAGPVLSWKANRRLLGDLDIGHIDVDWSLGAGVLFGKQKTSAEGQGRSTYYARHGYDPLVETVEAMPVSIPRRSKSVSVPVVDLSVGVSYEIQRVKIGAGYRWERYFNVLDAGYAEHKSYDRTIDGPYFKVSLGFGG